MLAASPRSAALGGQLPVVRGARGKARRRSSASASHAMRRRSSVSAAGAMVAAQAGKSAAKQRGRRRSSRLADINHLRAQLTSLSCGETPGPDVDVAFETAPRAAASAAPRQGSRPGSSMSMTELCEHARMSESSAALSQAKHDASLDTARSRYTKTRDHPTASENMRRLALEHARGRSQPRCSSAAEAIQNQRARRERGAGSLPAALAKTPEQRWRNRRQSNSSVLSLPGL